ncbi:MAG: branched-chain amino acid ABC transporter permease [Acetobacteraceae bacterium]|nr:branched-chain amino acid ABC transporter permease [Acetobacteraceae bacterium]
MNTTIWGFSRPQVVALLVMIALFVVAPMVVYPVFLMKVLCFALFACAFNLLIGYAGLLSFGHSAYFGMGCYLAAYGAKHWGLSAELCVLLGGSVAAVMGLVFGAIAIRRQGIYFSMITLALAQFTYFICTQMSFTGGEDGIQQVPRPAVLGLLPLDNDMAIYWMVVGVFLLGFFGIFRIIHSPFGQVLKAIRENEQRAISLGYRVEQYKLMAFVLSTFIAGAAGGMKSLVFGIATLSDVTWQASGTIVLTTLLGGLGTIFGPVVGAVIVNTLEFYLAPFGSWVTITQGVIFVACVMVFRRGVIGELGAKLKVAL